MDIVTTWLAFLREVLSDCFTLQFGGYTIFQIFLALACISVVSSALLLKVGKH